MQDYYKILGVKEDASADEIRDRWVELMREFHPDQAKELEGEENQKRVKEINEAYQVLKHSSTRLEYDLRKTYGQRKNRFASARMIVPLGIVLILIIAGIIYSNRPFTPRVGGPMPSRDPLPPSSQSEPPEEVSSPDNRVALSPEPGVPAKSGQAVLREEEKEKGDETPQATRPQVIRNDESGPSALSETVKPTRAPASRPLPGGTGITAQAEIPPPIPRDAGQKTGQDEMSRPVSVEAEKPISPERARPVNQETVKVSPLSSHPVIPPAVQSAPPSVPAPKAQEKNMSRATIARSQDREAVIPKQERATVPPMPKRDQTASTIETDAMFEKKWIVYHPSVFYSLVGAGGETGQSEPNALMAEEAEIKQFLLNYRERYVRRDAAGFLQLFSAKAVQNQKQGFDGIRRIYVTFFDQSQDLRYLADELVIEVYQNAVEVKGQYRVDQTLKKGGEKRVWTGPIRWIFIRENGLLKILSLEYQNVK